MFLIVIFITYGLTGRSSKSYRWKWLFERIYQVGSPYSNQTVLTHRCDTWTLNLSQPEGVPLVPSNARSTWNSEGVPVAARAGINYLIKIISNCTVLDNRKAEESLAYVCWPKIRQCWWRKHQSGYQYCSIVPRLEPRDIECFDHFGYTNWLENLLQDTRCNLTNRPWCDTGSVWRCL